MNPILTINPDNVTEQEASGFEIRLASRGIAYDEHNRLALLPVTKHGYYKLPGGGIDEGEDKDDAFRRECLEEIGYDVEIETELGEVVEYRTQSQRVQTSYCFIGRRKGDKQQTALTEHEIENGFIEPVWVTLDEAIELMKNQTENYHGKFIVERDAFLLDLVKSLNK